MGINGLEALVNDSVAESHDDVDVPAALQRDTHDGPGDTPESELPPSDFVEEAE